MLQVATGTCFVRLDLHSFNLFSGGQSGHVGQCSTDWLAVIGAAAGEERVGGVCGERSGHASKERGEDRQGVMTVLQ